MLIGNNTINKDCKIILDSSQNIFGIRPGNRDKGKFDWYLGITTRGKHYGVRMWMKELDKMGAFDVKKWKDLWYFRNWKFV